ncbi:MAG: DNA-3-methyladenine glycosylase I [Pseudomonadota bacterium]
MRSFEELYGIAAERKGGPGALDALLEPAVPPDELALLPDDRWLSILTKAVFSAGFNWKVVENKWPGFEEAFKGFDVGAVAFMDDVWFDRLLTDTRVIRNGAKLRAVQENAVLLQDLASDHGSAARAIAYWPREDYVGLLELLKTRGSRLGGTTAQYALRFGGRDGFILSKDVVARLVAEGIVDKAPTSKKALAAVQVAFNDWSVESGRGLKEISRVLAMSV